MWGDRTYITRPIRRIRGSCRPSIEKARSRYTKLEENILDMLADNQYKATTGSEAGKNPLQI